MTSFKSISLIVFVSSLFGCVKADKNTQSQSDDLQNYSVRESLQTFNNRSMFEAGNITIFDKQFSLDGDDDFKGANRAQLWFEVCGILDRASRGTIRNEKFHISSELGDDISWNTEENEAKKVKGAISNPIIVNSKGCLRWSQNIPKFDILATSVNVVLHFEITSLSGNFGKIIRRVGFNPWDMYRNNSKFSGVIDLTDFNQSDWPAGQWISGKESVVAALKGELMDSTAQLWVDSPKIETNEKLLERKTDYNKRLEALSPAERKVRKEIDDVLLKKSGININVNLTAKPFVRVTDSTGMPHDVDLTTGKFKVYMSIVAKGAGDDAKKYLLSSDVHSLTGRSTAFTWEMSAQGLQASIPLLLKQRTEFGRVSLVMKIEPVSLGLRKVKPFMAVYNLGEYDQWVKSQSPQIDREGYEALNDVDYDKYLKDVDGTTKNLVTLRDAERFYLGPFTMRFMRVMPGESATDRTMQYRVETCIEMGLDGRRVGPGLQFEIKTKDQYRGDFTIRRQTNENGCLTWFGFLSHKYYRKEVLEKKTAEIKYLGTHSDKDQSRELVNTFEKKYTYYMNPWDEKWTFGWDERDMPENYPEEIAEQRKTAPETKLFVADFRYETMGFRYSIDKYLNLKVKKSVLLKVYPYVLKYNSIVLGRNGTEKLRDGVYLMKVALQKDYLDPAARGVKIYDSRVSPDGEVEVETHIAKSPLISVKDGENINLRNLENVDIKELDEKLNSSLSDLKVYNVLDNEFGAEHAEVKGNVSPMLVDADDRSLKFDKDAWATDEVLRQSQKQYISVEQKLVRVMGGMIITPVEFEIEDLRLMRIRNQFFIQLQTVDENKLRVATILDDTLNNMYKDWNFKDKYTQIFTALGETGDFDTKKIQDMLDRLQEGALIKSTLSELAGRGQGAQVAQMKLFETLGLTQFEEGSEEYKAHFEDIKAKLLRILQYKENGLDELAAFRNDKRLLINSIVREMQEKGVQDLESLKASVSKEYNTAIDRDPFLKFMFAGGQTPSDTLLARIIQERIKRAEESGDASKLAVLNSLGIADFTSSPLTPSYSFDMITNDGIHEPKFNAQGDEIDDDGHSGLPARTFVGPLTFVFNTNGSSLRPTDILNEQYCTTAFCEVDEVVAQNKVPAEAIEGAASLDANGQLSSDFSKPIFLSGDSINAEYENSKYYGYLKGYFNMTVDDLIAQKIVIDEEARRKLESGSQIRNFTKTMRLKHTLLRDRPQSRLKKIRYEECAATVAIERLSECFIDLTDAEKEKEILSKNQFFNQLNKREYSDPNNKLDIYDQINDRFYQGKSYYGIAQHDFTVDDVEQIINTSVQDVLQDKTISLEERNRQLKKHRGFQHRMCFVLAQNLFTQTYFKKNLKTERKTTQANKLVLEELEKMCDEYVGRLYGYPSLDGNGEKATQEYLNDNDDWNIPRENIFKFPPIVMERKARVYETTGRYVYRGGKSLNINLAASFNLSSSHGVKVSSTATWKPYDMASSAVIGLGAAGAGIFAGSKVGAAVGSVAGPMGIGAGVIVGGLVGGILKTIIGGFSFSRSSVKDESAGRNQGVTVSSGTFLVSQQAAIDIELGEYERCLVVRYHDSFLRIFMQQSKQLKKDFNDDTDFDSLGVMVCSGQPMNKCLPVKEKYYYFTQHFTEGDMLDSADLHNHPWLLQLRGIRDFMTFTSAIGAREVDYIDRNDWFTQTMGQVLSDATSFKTDGTYKENNKPQFEVTDQTSGINWPLDELSRTYFKVLPTFPGIYSFFEEKPEWPYHKTDAGSSFEKCEQ